VGLAEVVDRVKPTMLIGASSVTGSFTEAIVKEMAAHTDRPIIFPLCSPAARAEAKPADLIAWTDGRALIATGSAFAPVTHKGVTYVIGQMNNPCCTRGWRWGRLCREPAGSARHVRGGGECGVQPGDGAPTWCIACSRTLTTCAACR
jgi:hypothetical protein